MVKTAGRIENFLNPLFAGQFRRISQARQQVSRSRKELGVREQELQKFRSEAQQIRAPARTVEFQLRQVQPFRRSIAQAGGTERIAGRIVKERKQELGRASAQSQRIDKSRVFLKAEDVRINVAESALVKAKKQARKKVLEALSEGELVERGRTLVRPFRIFSKSRVVPKGAIGSTAGGGFLIKESSFKQQSLAKDKVIKIRPVSSFAGGGIGFSKVSSFTPRKIKGVKSQQAIKRTTFITKLGQSLKSKGAFKQLVPSVVPSRFNTNVFLPKVFQRSDIGLGATAVAGQFAKQQVRKRGLPSLAFQLLPKEKKQLSGKIVGEFIPTTKGQVIISSAVPFGASKAFRIAQGVRGGKTAFRLGSFGFGASELSAGIRAKDKPIETRIARGAVGFSALGGGAFIPTKVSGAIKLQKQLLKFGVEKGFKVKGKTNNVFIPKQAEKGLASGIKLQRFLRGQPDVPVKSRATQAIPTGLTRGERKAFEKVLKQDVTIFGSQATRLRGLQKKGGDIDIATVSNKRILKEFARDLKRVGSKPQIRGQAVSLAGSEKAFDIKPLTRLQEFPLFQKPVKTKEGVKITRLSEQFSRTLSGTLELRKGGKDIGGAVLSARAIVEQSGAKARATKKPFLREIRLIRSSIAERRLVSLESAVKPLKKTVSLFGEAKIAELPKKFRPVSQRILLGELKAFATSKKGTLGRSKVDISRGVNTILQQDIRKFKSPTTRKFFRPSKIKISQARFKPSSFKIFRPSGTKVVPSSLRARGKPRASGFSPSVFRPQRPRTNLPSVFRFRSPRPSTIKITTPNFNFATAGVPPIVPVIRTVRKGKRSRLARASTSLKRSKRKRQIFLQPTRFQPSLTSSILKITSKKIPRGAGAFRVRPILN